MNLYREHPARAAVTALIACCAAGLASPPLAAAEDGDPAWKLTAGAYRTASQGWSTDLNLRRTQDWGNAWLGFYNAPRDHERQWRLGADATLPSGPLRWQPALQVASHGYLAGSLGVETGSRWFVGAGIGRTNLKPNSNLNFDPNDAWTLSAGWRGSGGETAQLLWVRDNRQSPDQRHLHANLRQPLPDGQRLTVDVLFKQGLVDDAMVRRVGATLGWDGPRLFVRVAYDPKVNFTANDMWRVSAGTRF